MAENNGVAVPQQQTQQTQQTQQAGQQATHCSGNCKQCTLFQRQYCASQLALTNMRMMEKMMQQLQMMQMHMDDIDRKVEALQNNEAVLINPIETTQSGDGVR